MLPNYGKMLFINGTSTSTEKISQHTEDISSNCYFFGHTQHTFVLL